MGIVVTKTFQRQVRKRVNKDPSLKRALAKQFKLFRFNPRYPSLKLHKLKGQRSEQFSVWIKDDLRALAVKDGSDYIFFELVTHDRY